MSDDNHEQKPEFSTFLCALFMGALDLGFERGQFEIGEGGEIATTTLRFGYAGEPAAAAVMRLDGRRFNGPLEEARAYYGKLRKQLGADIEPQATSSDDWLTDPVETLEDIAHAYLRAHQVHSAAEARKKELSKALIARMVAQGRASVEVSGIGAVAYKAPWKRPDFDDMVAMDRIKAMAAELRACGKTADDSKPTKSTPISASIAVAWTPGV